MDAQHPPAIADVGGGERRSATVAPISGWGRREESSGRAGVLEEGTERGRARGGQNGGGASPGKRKSWPLCQGIISEL